MDSIFWQQEIENKYNKKHIDARIREEILGNPVMEAKIQQGITLLNNWMNKNYYQSKNARISQLKGMDIEELVAEVMVGTAYVQYEELFTSVTAQLASRLGFSDKKEAILTMAEIVSVLCATDAYDILKADKMASLMVISRIPLSEELIEFVKGAAYLPPMICKPRNLLSNYDSGYLTHKESLVLGAGNHHEGDLCLDVLDLINSVPLKLDIQFLSTEEENPTKEFTVEWAKGKALDKGKVITDAQAQADAYKAIANWMRFKRQSHEFYKLINLHKNKFYLTHRVDKRGRIYCSGYHISTQGTAYKKAMIELAQEEMIEVPHEYCI